MSSALGRRRGVPEAAGGAGPGLDSAPRRAPAGVVQRDVRQRPGELGAAVGRRHQARSGRVDGGRDDNVVAADHCPLPHLARPGCLDSRLRYSPPPPFRSARLGHGAWSLHARRSLSRTDPCHDPRSPTSYLSAPALAPYIYSSGPSSLSPITYVSRTLRRVLIVSCI